MHVLVQKDVGSRWLNRLVVMILVAIIAIQLSTYLKPEKDVAREEVARAAGVIAVMRTQQEREQREREKHEGEQRERESASTSSASESRVC